MYEIYIENWDATFIFLVSSELPDPTLALWEQNIIKKAKIPRWEELDQFHTNRLQTLETVSDIQSSRSARSLSSKAHVGQFAQSAQACLLLGKNRSARLIPRK